MDNKAVGIGILGGLGLGLLLGSQFYGSTITIAGAVIMVIALILMIGLSLKKK